VKERWGVQIKREKLQVKIVNAASKKEVSDRTKLGVAPPIQLPCECIKWKQKGHDLEEKDSKGRKLPRNMANTYTVAHYHCMIMLMSFNLFIKLAVKFNVTDSPSLSLMENAKQIQLVHRFYLSSHCPRHNPKLYCV
jgi:hypothetical protein